MEEFKSILKAYELARPFIKCNYGKMQRFIEFVKSKQLNLEKRIYACIDGSWHLKVGDNFSFRFPVSWSYEYESELQIAQEFDYPSVFSFQTTEKLRGFMLNNKRILLIPVEFLVVDKYIDNGVVNFVVKIYRKYK
jgi:hypothetical protein